MKKLVKMKMKISPGHRSQEEKPTIREREDESQAGSSTGDTLFRGVYSLGTQIGFY